MTTYRHVFKNRDTGGTKDAVSHTPAGQFIGPSADDRRCAAQFCRKIVNCVDPMMLVGAYRFPNNAAITALETAARNAASLGTFSADAILFGKWRD